MKKFSLVLLVFITLLSCSDSDDDFRRNPNLPDLTVRLQLNLNFPEYNDLSYAGNSFVTYQQGVKGVVVYNINNSQYSAFELSDPNHPPSQCSGMKVEGIIATCDCEENSYNIITGELSEGEGQYTMKPYRVQKSGNIIEVWN
ncbi:hypothetical protein E0K83_06275 [Gramella sp. BOM4]|nr:hypothetical protein [Christiangramia bathymodioli]